jgi:hypothetical protein
LRLTSPVGVVCASQVFSTPSGRTVDLATAYVQSSSVMLVVSPTMTQALVEKLNK